MGGKGEGGGTVGSGLGGENEEKGGGDWLAWWEGLDAGEAEAVGGEAGERSGEGGKEVEGWTLGEGISLEGGVGWGGEQVWGVLFWRNEEVCRQGGSCVKKKQRLKRSWLADRRW